MRSHPLVRVPTVAYVEFFRGTSAFVQIYWIYFALPLLGIRLFAMEAGTIVFALNVGAYGSEIFRGALRSVSQGSARRVLRWAYQFQRLTRGYFCHKPCCVLSSRSVIS